MSTERRLRRKRLKMLERLLRARGNPPSAARVGARILVTHERRCGVWDFIRQAMRGRTP